MNLRINQDEIDRESGSIRRQKRGAPRSGGLGLWNVPAAALALEAALYGLGAVLYLRATTARDGIGRWGLWILLALLPVLWLSAAFGPPPPDQTTLAGSALLLWLIAPWAGWVDRHRTAR